MRLAGFTKYTTWAAIIVAAALRRHLASRRHPALRRHLAR
jgi:hypothetical protein